MPPRQKLRALTGFLLDTVSDEAIVVVQVPAAAPRLHLPLIFTMKEATTMRKQDRIANQESQSQSSQQNGERMRGSESERMRGSESERMRGSESERMRGGGSETQRSQRPSGKLPLPD